MTFKYPVDWEMADIHKAVMDSINKEVNQRNKMYAEAYNRLHGAEFHLTASAIFKQLRGDMTYKQVSELSGISIAQWSAIEKERSQPSLATLHKVAEAFGKGFAMVLYDKE